MTRILILLLSLSALLSASHGQVPILEEGIVIDLREPEYVDGIVYTDQGGVIKASNVRIQARQMRYQHDISQTQPQDIVIAEGDVRLESFGWLFIGSKLEYNLTNQTGFIYDGASSSYPLYFGGRMIQICADGSYIIYNGFITSSESLCPEWKMSVDVARLFPNQDLTARQIKIKVCDTPIFWAPRLCTNLNTLKDIPVKYTVRWGGRQGSRIGMSYEIFCREGITTFLRLDYNFKRGLGGGLETHYRSSDLSERFDCINYAAHEEDPANEHINTRFRFQGSYRRAWRNGKTRFELKYDKLSDKQMATDYCDRGLDWEYARKTELLFGHQEQYWLAKILVRPRINAFQTIKQELPTLSLTALPYSLDALGVITSFRTNASYLDFQYAHGSVNARDFTATRIELYSSASRPFGNDYYKLTPRISTVGIFYGNRPYHGQYWLAAATASLDGQLLLSNDYRWGKHLMRPYFNYHYITSPTIPPNKHYIFDITDGWARVNTLRTGVQHEFFTRSRFFSPFHLDTYTWALIDNTKNIPHPIPYLTADLSFNAGGLLDNKITAIWDLSHGGFGELNYLSRWTVSRNLALSLEYRQRNAFFWRKVDRENFVLDYFRSQEQLLHSPLSDARRTLLFHTYYRINYDWAIEWKSRLGWDRRHEPYYFEYDIQLYASLPAQWHMKIAYQHKEVDDRFAVYFTLGSEKN